MRKVDRPALAPRRCAMCPTGYKGGPVIDTLVDTLDGRIYACLEHAKRIAVAAGFAEGEEMEKLKQAAEQLAQAEEAVQREQAMRRETAENLRAEVNANADLRDQLADAEGRAQQAERKLAELARGAAETVEAVHRIETNDPDPTPV